MSVPTDAQDGLPQDREADNAGSAAESDRLALDRFVPYRLSVLSNLVSRAVARIYAQRFDLAIPEWRVMAVLGMANPLSAAQICERTAMDKVRVSRAVSRLLEAKLITRRTSQSDRRRADLALSYRGQAIYDKIVPMAREAEAQLLATMSETEQEQLDHLLTKLQDRAEALYGQSATDLRSPND